MSDRNKRTIHRQNTVILKQISELVELESQVNYLMDEIHAYALEDDEMRTLIKEIQVRALIDETQEASQRPITALREIDEKSPEGNALADSVEVNPS